MTAIQLITADGMKTVLRNVVSIEVIGMLWTKISAPAPS